MKDGRLMVEEKPGMLVKCQIPGCDLIMPEDDVFGHEVGHPDPIVIEPPKAEPVVLSLNEEGVYCLTSSGEG